MKSKELNNLLEDISEKLNPIQKSFDNYQEKYFTTKIPQFFCLELCGETGELANLEKKIWKGREIQKDKLADEAADVFIAFMNYCNSRKIDLSEAVQLKLNKIERIRLEREEDGLDY